MKECTCYADYHENVVLCPYHLATDDMYDALHCIKEYCIHNGLELPDRLVIMASKALAKAEGK